MHWYYLLLDSRQVASPIITSISLHLPNKALLGEHRNEYLIIVYDGHWRKGVFDGWGEIKYHADGKQYKGQFKKEKWHGLGTVNFENEIFHPLLILNYVLHYHQYW